MNLDFVSLLAVIILVIAATTNKRHLQGALFCLLTVCVLVWWSAVSLYVRTWFELYSVSATEIEYRNVTSAYYLAGCAGNFMLLYYLNRYNTGYKLIAIPIAFYAVLGILVPLESLVLGTGAAYWLYNAAPELVNTVEVLLLAVDRHEYRRNGKQWIESLNLSLHTLSPYSLFDRIR